MDRFPFNYRKHFLWIGCKSNQGKLIEKNIKQQQQQPLLKKLKTFNGYNEEKAMFYENLIS